MPRFEPIPGIRYATDDLAAVTAPPYDVIDPDERAALAAQHPHNVVRIDLPVDGEDPYAEAASTFEAWQSEGVLAADDPALYLYRMSFTDEAGAARQTLGVVGALTLEEPGSGDVLPHEHTTPKAKSDRLQLLRSTHANLSAVWGLSLASGLSKLFDIERAEPLGSWHDGDGVGHDLWRLTDGSSITAITDAVAAEPVVIADGHHRYETSLAFHKEEPELAGSGATLCFVVELVDEQLTVQPIHRLLSGLPDDFDLPAALAKWFEVGPLGPLPGPDVVAEMIVEGSLGLVTPDGLRLLTPRVGALGQVRDLDSSRLDLARAGLPGHEVTYQHGVGHCVRAVTSGTAQAAVLLRPVSVAQIAATAHARDRMPPKSTFFWPKPRTGIVFRSLR